MPLKLSRLSCGVIYTEAFCQYIDSVFEGERCSYPRHVLSLDYIRCASGPKRGQAWWKLEWVPVERVPEYRCFRLGRVWVHFPKSAQHGLKERCLDWAEERGVVVFP